MDTISFVLTVVGTILSIASLFFAFWERKEKKKLEELIRANNWFNYQKANNTNAMVQLALKLYKEKHTEKIDASVLEQLSKADAHGQEVFKETIRQIQMFEPSFTKLDFERWAKEGKLNEDKTKLFMQFTTDAKIDSEVTGHSFMNQWRSKNLG